jgi:hypothetical protein
MKAKELVPVLEVLAAERLIYRVIGLIEFDENVFGVVTMVCAAGTEHYAKLGPILMSTGPPRESYRSPMNSKKPPATVNEFEQALSQTGIFEEIAHRVI